MKRIFLLLFATLLFASCSNDDDNVAAVQIPNRVTFKVNGESVLIENFEESDLLDGNNQKIGRVVYGYNKYSEEPQFKKYHIYMYLEGPNTTGNYHVLGIEVYVPDAPANPTAPSSTLYANWVYNNPDLPLVYDFKFPSNRLKGTFSAQLINPIDSANLTDGIIEYNFEK